MSKLELVGRSSSHYTRTARIIGMELGVPFEFRPVYDMATLDTSNYAENPALKVPILMLSDGPLFGTENICREFARHSKQADRVVLRGAVGARLVANSEELTLHAMSNQVTLITAKFMDQGHLSSPKITASIANALAFLDARLDETLALLPRDRATSFFEAALYCAVLHFGFRETLDTAPYGRLRRFAEEYGDRPSARETPYKNDVR